MTVIIDITTETQSRLEARAKVQGMSLHQYLQHVLDGIARDEEADEERLAVSGESLTTQVWPAEDFSDWK